MTTLIVDAQWAEKNAGYVVSYNGKDYTIGTDAFASLNAALATANANSDVTAIEIASDITEAVAEKSVYVFENRDFVIDAAAGKKVTVDLSCNGKANVRLGCNGCHVMIGDGVTFTAGISVLAAAATNGDMGPSKMTLNGKFDADTVAAYMDDATININGDASIGNVQVGAKNAVLNITGDLSSTATVGDSQVSIDVLNTTLYSVNHVGSRTVNIVNAHVDVYEFANDSDDLVVNMEKSILCVENSFYSGASSKITLKDGSRFIANEILFYKGNVAQLHAYF